jgi:hypothetical protein
MYIYQDERSINMKWHVSVMFGQYPTVKLGFSRERCNGCWSASKLDKHESNACSILHVQSETSPAVLLTCC